jgi:uncharacterized protein YlxP (DUF503 family)
MAVGILTIHLFIPGCASLKEKRSHLKPFLHRVHLEFNVSIAETDYQDKWTESMITVTNVSNDSKINQAELNHVINYIKNNFHDLEIIRDSIEII